MHLLRRPPLVGRFSHPRTHPCPLLALALQEPSAADLHRFPYAEACLNEALRLYPPAHVTNRCAVLSGPATSGGVLCG